MGDFFTGVRDFPLAQEVLPITFIPLLMDILTEIQGARL